MDAERRQVTVVFADMVGFTAFSERSGEEAAFTLMRSLSKLLDAAVHAQGGVVQSFTGDGIMAVFGAPVSFEDAPLRACRAALSILDGLKAAAPELEAKYGHRPELRIGLNTGTAVVGKVQSGTDGAVTVLGDTVNFAARLQALAQPDSILMSEATHRLVQGIVEEDFAGEQSIKGKSDPQRIYRLNGIRKGVTRFEAALSRGLSTFVGREREIELLERALLEARSELRVLDVVADPGMGKSRLLHEFRQRIGTDRIIILVGSCSPDGQQTPFLPFIEVVRRSFRVDVGDAENDVSQKVEVGLSTLGLHSARNVGLLLHLLGLRDLTGALTGLDGALIGLGTRELLRQLLEASCKLFPVVMAIEDLHWIDSASEELLSKVVDNESNLRLLLLHTRRPEYIPLWLNRSVVRTLRLEPLPAGEVRRLVQGRLGAVMLPDDLARQVTQRAEGNPLFAEELVSFLTERGVLLAKDGTIDVDARVLAAVLPASVQGLLTARVDRLVPKNRALLQAASVIGRRFDVELLAAAVGYTDGIDAQLAELQGLDLVRIEGKQGAFWFKHALVRDALYQSLLAETRKALHSKIAAEIERRSGNRLIEVAETLAHHYTQTDQADKAFTYVAMAGSRSLSVYSLEEAEAHFSAAIALVEEMPTCASDEQIANVLVDYTLLLNALGRVSTVVDIVEKFSARVRNLGCSFQVVSILHQKIFALCFMTKFREALSEQTSASRIADLSGDNRAKLYAFAGQILVSSAVAPKTTEELKPLVQNALEMAARIDDSYIGSVIRWVVAIDEVSRGRMVVAREIANEMSAIGRNLNDPRPRGMGMGILGWIALTGDDYNKALHYAEECLEIAYTPQERMNALGVKGSALALVRRIEEAQLVMTDIRRRLIELKWGYELILLGPAFGILAVLTGKLRAGVRIIQDAIEKAHEGEWRVAEDWAKLFLCEVYLEVMFPQQKAPLSFVIRNIFTVVKIMLVGPSVIRTFVSQIRNNPQFDKNGHHIGRAEMVLGLLYKGKKKRILALSHLAEARRILGQFGQTPILARVETALAELQ